jgi:hypothetical protein
MDVRSERQAADQPDDAPSQVLAGRRPTGPIKPSSPQPRSRFVLRDREARHLGARRWSGRPSSSCWWSSAAGHQKQKKTEKNKKVRANTRRRARKAPLIGGVTGTQLGHRSAAEMFAEPLPLHRIDK